MYISADTINICPIANYSYRYATWHGRIGLMCTEIFESQIIKKIYSIAI